MFAYPDAVSVLDVLAFAGIGTVFGGIFVLVLRGLGRER